VEVIGSNPIAPTIVSFAEFADRSWRGGRPRPSGGRDARRSNSSAFTVAMGAGLTSPTNIIVAMAARLLDVGPSNHASCSGTRQEPGPRAAAATHDPAPAGRRAESVGTSRQLHRHQRQPDRAAGPVSRFLGMPTCSGRVVVCGRPHQCQYMHQHPLHAPFLPNKFSIAGHRSGVRGRTVRCALLPRFIFEGNGYLR
jgi:hypothetical protein